jgi:hypothetical protein
MITLGAEACFDHVLRSISANAARHLTRRSEAQAARAVFISREASGWRRRGCIKVVTLSTERL